MKAINHLTDLIGGLTGTGRKCSDLVCHNRKATPLLPRSRRFNGGVQRQQVGLFRDSPDHFDNTVNVLTASGNLPYRSAGLIHIARQCTHAVQGRRQRILGKTDAILGHLRVFSCLTREACHFTGGGGHFVHGGNHAFDVLMLALGLLVGFLGDHIHIRRLLADLGVDVFQVVDHFP